MRLIGFILTLVFALIAFSLLTAQQSNVGNNNQLSRRDAIKTKDFIEKRNIAFGQKSLFMTIYGEKIFVFRASEPKVIVSNNNLYRVMVIVEPIYHYNTRTTKKYHFKSKSILIRAFNPNITYFEDENGNATLFGLFYGISGVDYMSIREEGNHIIFPK